MIGNTSIPDNRHQTPPIVITLRFIEALTNRPISPLDRTEIAQNVL